jgi:hypothetical protein
MTWVVNVHDTGGSTAEAVFPEWSATVEDAETATKLEEEIYEAFKGTDYDGEILVTAVEVEDPSSVEEALESLRKEHWFEEDEDLDEEEAALHRKVDGMMAGETGKLDNLFKDTYHQKRQTPIYTGEFTRYPVEDGYQPYKGTAVEEDFGDDPFADYTDEQLASMSDDEFAAILRNVRNKKEEEGI